jgi:hypothetical protein
MKNIFYILLLLPTIIFAQYPNNSGHKITLGEQTTADGLIFRGVAADTTLTAKSDTAAYFVLDTVNINLYTYKASATGRKWRQLGADTAAIAYVNTYGTQTVNGAKTFSNITTFADSIKVQGIRIGKGTVNDESNLSIGVRNLTASTTSGGGNNGLNNTSIGLEVLRDNTTGNQNTGIGVKSLQLNTTGSLNVGLGSIALQFNTTGNNNLGIGTAALRKNTTGSANIGIGRDALVENTTASNNIAIGLGALNNNTTGFDNTAVGYGAGWANSANNNTTGSNNTFIGNYAVGESPTESNRTWIGNTNTTSTWVGGNLLVGTRTNSGSRLVVKGVDGTSTNSALNVTNSSDVSLLFVRNDGNVGIGIASPTEKLHVVGNGLFTGSVTANSLSLTNPLPVANGGTNTSTAFKAGSVVFAGTSGTYTQDSSGLFYNSTNKRLAVGQSQTLTGAALSVRGGLHIIDPDTTNGTDNLMYIYPKEQTTSGANATDFVMFVAGPESNTRTQGPYFLMRGNNFTRSTNQKGLVIFASGDNVPAAGNNGKILFQGQHGLSFDGASTFSSLAGTVSRTVLADANGLLSAPTSSITTKENVQVLNYGLNEILQINPVSFDYIDKNKWGEERNLGFIVEDMFTVIPEVTGTMNNGDMYLDMTKLIPVLTKAIQEQNALIKALEQRILILENK